MARIALAGRRTAVAVKVAVLKAAATVLVFAVVVPVWIVLATKAGLEPTHWAGTRLVDVELPLTDHHGDAAPEPANVLLSVARTMDEGDAGDLAPSYWDGDAGVVVLGAVTDHGADVRRALGDSSGTAYRVERLAHSARELTGIQNDVLPWAERGALSSYVDPEHNRVILAVTRLSQGLFTDVAARDTGALVVVATPFGEPGYLDGRPVGAPTWWSRSDPPGTWLTLATGFPWYVGTAAVVVAAIWIVPMPRRCRPSQPAPVE